VSFNDPVVKRAHFQPRVFSTTRWSVVLRAGAIDADQASEALEQLCRDYWYPLYAFVRRKGYSAEDSADLTQEFFAKLLRTDFAAGLQPEGGRFRSFLLTALNRFLINEWQKGRRAKRGSAAVTGSLEALIEERGEAGYLSEASHEQTPDYLFQRTWAETMLVRVLDRLAAECRDRRDMRFEVLRPFLVAGEEPPKLADAAESLAMTVTAFKSLLHRFRQRYRELLLDEVSQTVSDPVATADELRALLQVLRGG
jgi:RNA polymerase sigma-70 factor (ECF subfamily)